MNKKGFTLIELLIVIAVIGLLSAIAVASLNISRTKARDAKRKVDLKAISQALELYYAAHGTYPDGGGGGGVCASDWACWNSGGIFANALGPYMAKLPQDPNFDSRGNSVTCNKWMAYVYERKSLNSYCLAGTLENLNDSAIRACNKSCHSTWPNFYFTN